MLCDLFFDPWLTLRTPYGPHPLVREALDTIAAHADRRRARREVDQENHVAVVDVILANMVRAVLHGAEPYGVAVQLWAFNGTAGRYDRAGLGRMRPTLGVLDRLGLLHLWVSDRPGLASHIRPSAMMVDQLCRDLSGGSLGEHGTGAETIILNRKEWEPGGVRSTVRVDYQDTPETVRLRAEVATINGHLEAARLGFLGNGPVDLRRRKLHRIFNLPPPHPVDAPRFDMGGRLFGGFWLAGMPSEDRQWITIGGQRTVELDFASMFVRLAYRHMDAVPPEGDLYRRIAGVRSKGHREAVKKALNAFLFRPVDRPMSRLPRGLKELLPSELQTVPALRDAILRAHPALDGVLDTPLGYRLMNIESDIMVAILLRLDGMGITALPLHDGLMVAEDDARTAERVLGDEAEEVTGCRLPVGTKARGGRNA